ncbi:MAG: SLC13 family permease [Gammaproteobacteria bacterium]|nr:SLC13 family permease [Gammaproteobacteria bacterium]
MTDEKAALPIKKIIAAIVFALGALWLTAYTPSIEVAWVTVILVLTIYLFAFEIVSVDIAAISIMVLLGLTGLLAPLMGLEQGLVDTQNLFDGFSSNAVMSIIAVMIIGAGLDKTGLMAKVAVFILKVGGKTERRIIPIISGTVGVISSFMQNVGAAALFLPVVSRISSRSGLPMSRLLMPMGFCAILGGTMTMVGSSPLILLNDLMATSNQALPADQQMETWGLFAVTPVGLALVFTGIIYFVLFGRYILPKTAAQTGTKSDETADYFKRVYGIDYDLYELVVPEESPLVSISLRDIEHEDKVRIVAVRSGEGNLHMGEGGISRETGITAGSVLGVLASPKNLLEFSEKYDLDLNSELVVFADALSSEKSGIADIVIPPGSSLIDKSATDLWLRKTYGVALVALHRDGNTLYEGEDIRTLPFKAGDTMIVHTSWEALARLESDSDFVIVTTEYPHEEARPHKVGWAALFFSIALGMILFSDVLLSVALLTGALGMVLSGVIKIEEAYKAVSWKTVFLLASLIPLGLAVETSGTARWIAEQTLSVVGHMDVWVIQAAVAILATFFTLVMSNVGATVLLVPLAVNIAVGVGASPAVFALTVAIATSNSFLIPTHQVNALIMGPGGYRVPDFMKAGGVMTILFLIVMIAMMNLIF